LSLEDLSPQQRREYEKHPELGGELLASLPAMNPLIPHVIFQHHERKDRSGFPGKIGSGQISPVSELIGISELFHDLLGQTEGDPLARMEADYWSGFSPATIAGFRRAFLREGT
jgi:HD-GYP domain-containing protein (c-di-GMP phosphodiesterase class II)